MSRGWREWRPGRWAFSAIWLVYLGFPLGYMLSSSAPAAVKALHTLAVVVFACLYIVYWVYAFGRPRLRWTLLGLCTVLAIAIALPVSPQNWVTPMLYVACMCAFDPSWRRGGALAAAAVLLAGGVTYAGGHDPLQTAVSMGMTALSAFACFGIAGIIRANIALRSAREEIARLAVAEERLRFARDLHDLLGHSLSVIVLKAELASKMGPRAPERAAGEVADIERVARDALREVRDAVSGYRQMGLSQELESARHTLEAAGIDVQVDQRAGALPTPVETTLAWAVREAATNVIRHSGARQVWISLVRTRDQVRLTIRDDGRGEPGTGAPVVAGNGLRGVTERLRARGGDVSFGPTDGAGFELDAGLPLTQSPAPESTPA